MLSLGNNPNKSLFVIIVARFIHLEVEEKTSEQESKKKQ